MSDLFTGVGNMDGKVYSAGIDLGDRVQCADDIVRTVVAHTCGGKDIYVSDGATIIKVSKTSVTKLNGR